MISVLQALHASSQSPAVWSEIDRILAPKDRTQFDEAVWEVERKARLERSNRAYNPSTAGV